MKNFLAALLLLPSLAFAQGAHRISQIITRGPNTTAEIAPFAVVTVCEVGTNCVTLVNIYSDQGLTTPIPNPLTADENGNFDYYVGLGCVDERYTYPGAQDRMAYNVCLTNSATVTNFSAGNLSPLFTTSVATSTTTPALTFALSTTPNFTFYGNFSGATVVPKFWTLAAGSNITLTPNTGTGTITVAAASAPTQTCGALTDTTSTNCGNGNQVGNTGTHVSTFGSTNVIGSNASNFQIAIGTNNLSVSALGTENIFVGDGNLNLSGGATLAGAANVIIQGNRNFNTFTGASSPAVSLSDVIVLAHGTAFTSGTGVVALGISPCGMDGQPSASFTNVNCIGNGAGANSTAVTGAVSVSSADFVGNGAGAQLQGTITDFEGMGDGSCGGFLTGSHDCAGFGNNAATGALTTGVPTTTVSNLAGIGDEVAGQHGTGSTSIGGVGELAAFQQSSFKGVDTNSDDIYAVGHDVCNNLGASSSDVFCLGHSINGTAGATLTNAIGIGHGITLASNTTTIGNASTATLKIFGSGNGCLSSTSGLITGSGSACATPPVTTRTCGMNGCYRVEADGTIEEWGIVTAPTAGGTVVNATITFPSAFPTALASLTVSGGSMPDGSDDAYVVYFKSPSTSGATAVVRCSVNIGGSGCGALSSAVPINWFAIGN